VYEITVTTEVPKTFGEKLADRFNNSIGRVWNATTSFALWFLGNIVEITIVLGVVVLAVFLVVRTFRKVSRRKQ
jgi:4-hydroxybenzoate polyprenyltransferase